MRGTRRPRVVQIGAREILAKGLPYGIWSDISHRAITMRWPAFVGAVAALFLAVSCLFATLYTLGDKPVSNADGGFLDHLFFSIETLTTVGYGDMHPRTTYGHLVASLELFTGVLTSAAITGLFIYRFTRATPRILFADVATVASHDGRMSLMVRLANQRLNAISSAQARLWMLVSYVTAEGVPFRRFEELRLLRDHSPLFTLSWTVIHAIDEASPMLGLDAGALAEQDASFVVTIEGYDETSGQTVRARKMYHAEHIRFGARYADILEVQDGHRTVLDYDRFHHTLEDGAEEA